MSWRIVQISSRAKLDYRMNYMVIRGEETTKIHISEISIVIIENTAVSLTAALLSELTKNKIKVIFCDEKRNPSSELVSYYGSHDTSLKVRNQTNWSEDMKKAVWAEITSEKIRNQGLLLRSVGKPEAKQLFDYADAVEFGDATNREGPAAKVYFNALFGNHFSRASDNIINAALNYGYSILLSAFTREITAAGYITQIGIFHNNVFNQFNLACDLMEPFRPLVDEEVCQFESTVFEREEKMKLVNILNSDVIIEGRNQYVNNAIRIYCKSIFDCFENGELSSIRFFRNEL